MEFPWPEAQLIAGVVERGKMCGKGSSLQYTTVMVDCHCDSAVCAGAKFWA